MYLIKYLVFVLFLIVLYERNRKYGMLYPKEAMKTEVTTAILALFMVQRERALRGHATATQRMAVTVASSRSAARCAVSARACTTAGWRARVSGKEWSWCGYEA